MPPAQPRMPAGPPERKGLFDSLGYYYRFFKDPLGTVAGRFAKYGDLYYAPSKGVGLYVLRHPDHLHEVLVKNAAHYGKTHSAFELLVEYLGHGLLTTDGDVWRRQRRMINPVFARPRLEGYVDSMVDEASHTIERWSTAHTREMSGEMMELTLQVVCRTLFGPDVRAELGGIARAMAAFRGGFGPTSQLPRWMPVPSRRRALRGRDALDKILFGMIAARRSGVAPTPVSPDLLQLLLEAKDDEGDGEHLGDREIRDQLVTLFLAGHETTSHALTWTLYLLSQNPQVEAILHAELDRVLGGRCPTFADVEALVYTRQLFEESMRLYPPAYTLARRAVADTEIGGYQIPQGSEIILWIYHTHHDERWYPEPQECRPERFAPEEVAQRPKLSYLPFGSGARACIGKMFAQIEGQLLLAMMAQRYRFKLAPGHKVVMHPRVTLSPKYGMKMILHPR